MKLTWVYFLCIFLLSSCVDNMEDLPEFEEEIGTQTVDPIKTKPPVVLDNREPALIGQLLSSISDSTATIALRVDEQSKVAIQYGTNNSYAFSVSSTSFLTEEHSIILKNLMKGTTYQYRIIAEDAAGNRMVSPDFSFVTRSEAKDIVAPKLVTEMKLALTFNSIAIKFNFDELVTAYVEYGTSSSYGAQTVESVLASLEFLVPITGLRADQSYHYRIIGKDLSGNMYRSMDYTFKTLKIPPDVTAPIISNILPSGEFPAGTKSINLTLDTNENSSCRYSAQQSAAFMNMQVMTQTTGQKHAQIINGLLDGKNYIYYVLCSDIAGNISSKGIAQFSVKALELDGKKLYAANCMGCHGDLANSTKINNSAAIIKNAIDNNAQMKAIAALRALTVEQVAEISKALIVLDMKAPVLQAQAATATTQVETTIVAKLDELATFQINYGLTAAYGMQTVKVNDLKLDHSQKILGLKANTIYHYQIIAIDKAGNQLLSPDYTFKTIAEEDKTSPVISMLAPAGELPPGTTSTNLTLFTNEKSSCRYSTSAGADFSQMLVMSTSGASNHSQTVSGLMDGMTYNYFVLCQDESKNTSLRGQISFKVKELNLNGANLYLVSCKDCHGDLANSAKRGRTVAQIQNAIDNEPGMKDLNYLKALLPAQVVEIAKVLVVVDNDAPKIVTRAVSDTTETTVKVNFVLDEDADAQIEFGESTAYGRFSTKVLVPGKSHSIVLTNLKSDTTYHYRVISSDAKGNRLVSGDYTFKTAAPVDVMAPMLSAFSPQGELNFGTKTISVSLVTNEKAICKYSLSATATYAQMANMAVTGESNHSQTVNGLEDGKSYKYYIACSDLAKNTTPKSLIEFSVKQLVLDGKILYTTNCQSCHNPLANSTKKGANAVGIQAAINSVPGMKFLNILRAEQVQAIATALNEVVVGDKPEGKLSQKYIVKSRLLLASKYKRLFVNSADTTEDRNIANIIDDNISDDDLGLFGGVCQFTDASCPGSEDVKQAGLMSPNSSPARSATIYNTCTEILIRDRSITNVLSLASLTSGSIANDANMREVFDTFFPGIRPSATAISDLRNVHSRASSQGLSNINKWRMVMTPMCHSSLFEVY